MNSSLIPYQNTFIPSFHVFQFEIEDRGEEGFVVVLKLIDGTMLRYDWVLHKDVETASAFIAWLWTCPAGAREGDFYPRGGES